MLRFGLPFAALCVVGCATVAPAQQQVENVAAFARLYGVARWFYPSDAAAALDWNRFAVDGVRRVRAARTSVELETILEELFTPLGPGIEIGASPLAMRPPGRRDASLVGWHYRGAGISEIGGPYSAKRTNRVTRSSSQATAFSTIMQTIPADTLRGKTIRMRGQVRVADPNAEGWTGMWLRVDRTGEQMGFFDNMQNRPVRDTTWREYVIEGPIATDATHIAFGVLSAGSMAADIDAIEIAVRDLAGNWTPLVIPDASFEGDGGGRGWSQNGGVAGVRPSSGAAHGARYARLARAAVGQALPAVPADSLETPIVGAAVDVELSRGLKARVPMSLTDAEARTESPALTNLRAALGKMDTSAGRDDVDVRLADVVVAWGVFRHFYPYWPDIQVDWDARLRPHLQSAFDAATTREAHLEALRMVVADLRDGHGSVRDVAAAPQSVLPVRFRILGTRLVVTASTDSAVPVGSVVAAINGTPASAHIRKQTQLASGSPQWRHARAASALQTCKLESTVTVTIELPRGTRRDATLPCKRSVTGAVEARPNSIVELQSGVLESGIWYVDLTRVRAAQLRPMLETLARARAVIFDVRGYPTDAGAEVLPHLMRTPEDSTDRWMHVSRIAGPFGEVAEWNGMSWKLQPATPHIGGQRVFLTDGRAISYAESVMGYVRDHKLGTIIGGATAGANGNVASFTVPGGFSIMFTGMRVTRHDGRTPFHVQGVLPDIQVEPTLTGIRAGRDELLERALATLQVQPGGRRQP